MSSKVKIHEGYDNWNPPLMVQPVIAQLLKAVPEQYLSGLGSVVLTNASGLSRSRRRARIWSRKRLIPVTEALGLYHHAQKAQTAWIELFVDNILAARWTKTIPKSAYVRDLVFAQVLYHELGHHIHHTHRPEHREPENIANAWSDRMTNSYMWRKHWLLRLSLWPSVQVQLLWRRLKTLARRLSSGNVLRSKELAGK